MASFTHTTYASSTVHHTQTGDPVVYLIRGYLGRRETVLYAFAPARKSHRIRLLFTHNNGDFGAISVTERSCTAKEKTGGESL